jgi:hypothetical protein
MDLASWFDGPSTALDINALMNAALGAPAGTPLLPLWYVSSGSRPHIQFTEHPAQRTNRRRASIDSPPHYDLLLTSVIVWEDGKFSGRRPLGMSSAVSSTRSTTSPQAWSHLQRPCRDPDQNLPTRHPSTLSRWPLWPGEIDPCLPVLENGAHQSSSTVVSSLYYARRSPKLCSDMPR